MATGVLSQSNELDEIDRSSDERTFWNTFESIIKTLDIDFYIYLFNVSDTHIYHRTNMSTASYQGPEQDPFLKYCCSNMGATFVGVDYNGRFPFLSDDERSFVEQAAQGGWMAGVAIPVRVRHHERFGGFNLGSRMSGQQFEAATLPRLDRLRTLCLVAQQKIEDLGLIRAGDGGPEDIQPNLLTKRERQLARLLHSGLDRNKIAMRIGISPLTVATHQKSIYRKLGIHSQREIMRIASLKRPSK